MCLYIYQGAPSPDYAKTAKMLMKFLFSTFHLKEAVSEYYENIKKFKVARSLPLRVCVCVCVCVWRERDCFVL